jgi:hypothetical protein
MSCNDGKFPWACTSKRHLKLNHDYSEKLSKFLSPRLCTPFMNNTRERQWGTESATSRDQLTASIGVTCLCQSYGQVAWDTWPLVRPSHGASYCLGVSLSQCEMIPLCSQCLMLGLEANLHTLHPHNVWSRGILLRLQVQIMSNGLVSERRSWVEKNLCSFRVSRLHSLVVQPVT